MKKRFLPVAFIAALVMGGVWLSSCDNDDDDDKPGDKASIFTIENVSTVKDFVQSGTFVGQGATGDIIAPGESVHITFNAAKGQALMFATMYGYSNDIFFAPANPGIALYKADGTPITGDVSSSIKLWDNGTRINEKPGPSINHPGTINNGKVKMINGTDDEGNTYPAASDLMKLQLTYDKTRSQFTLIITNVSNNTANETPFSPGVWVVSNVLQGKLVNEKPFFIAGENSTADLTKLAEEGNVDDLYNTVKDKTGIITTLSPTLVVIYTGDINPIYQLNNKDSGNGLKTLAQTGNANALKESLSKLSNVRNVYIAGKDVLYPGDKTQVQYSAYKGDNIAFATMFGYSNDWFYSNGSSLTAITAAEITAYTKLLDDGTAVSQYPGAGNAQAIFGGTQIPEDKVISEVGDTFPVPSVSSILKVTLR